MSHQQPRKTTPRPRRTRTASAAAQRPAHTEASTAERATRCTTTRHPAPGRAQPSSAPRLLPPSRPVQETQ